MKKTLAAAITSALVIGAASTTFAAANPFSDVPTDHWSFDAVTKLAQEGVIEGYGDGTFNGNAHITRYEMAQMVAKAMAKSGSLGESDQALIDRLAAEYADELNNLGVRVAELEKKSDNVKFEGLLRLTGERIDRDSSSTKENNYEGKFRLDVTAKVNDDWNVKGRLDAVTDFKNGGTNDEGVELVRAYAEGELFGGANTKIGEFGVFDAENLTNGGLLLDTEVSGVEFKFGNELKTTLTYGRLSDEDYAYLDGIGGPSEYGAIQFAYDVNDNLALAAGWHHLKNKAGGYPGASDIFLDGNGWTDTNNIWALGFDYKFNQDWILGGLYAQSDLDLPSEYGLDDNEKSYSVQLTYKGAQTDVVGSYGIWAAYRQVGAYASMNPTYDGAMYGTKGYELGVDYMLDKNILAKVIYFDGEYLYDGPKNDVNKIFGRLEFTF